MRYFWIFCLFLITLPISTYAQSTSSSSRTLEVAVDRGDAIRLVLPNKRLEFGRTNLLGRSVVRNVAYTVNLDSLVDQIWEVQILDHISSGVRVRVLGRELYSTTNFVDYEDTLRTVAQFVIPDRKRSNQPGFQEDSLFYFTFNQITPRWSSSENFFVQISKFAPAMGTSDGWLKAAVLDYAHHELHEGDFYTVDFDSTLASANDSLIAVFITSADSTNLVHLRYEVDATAKTYFVLKEGATYTSGDTLTIFNSNRTSNNTSGSAFVKGAVTPIGGTVIRRSTLGASGAGKTGGEVGAEGVELILKPNTKYSFIAAATAASVVNLRIRFYTHGRD